MTTTFLGFFVNRATREEFVAPIEADDATIARMEFYSAYPESRFQLLTVYSRKELEHVLSGVDRWPGLPSKVQEPVRTDLSKVTASTRGLPPLPGQVQAKIEQVDAATDTQPMPAWMKSFVQQQQIKAAAAPKAQATSVLEQNMAAPKTSLQQVSLIEKLKAARGETMAAPKAEPTIVQQAKAGSVIDILKGMRK
ncbi:MAG: hypothetical protein DI628_05460 [Blastochloris viridis]|uniref:Uncharacterized protein n=1 Tax=Blastochloris viridis TaxID=1079 RepID=A0A6N4R6C8_BLAVI|nr:MAG: hypothetical protein DI628_05460 [Blastochloris viridis]